MNRILLPMRSSQGLARSNTSRSPPHITVSVPSMARASMPEIGASRKAMPRSSSRFPISTASP
jgi:hypothetical protein